MLLSDSDAVLLVMQAPAPPKEPAKEEPPKFAAFQGKARTLKG